MKKQYRILKSRYVENKDGAWGYEEEQDVFVTDNLRKTVDKYVDKDTHHIAIRVEHDYVEDEYVLESE